MKFFKKSYTYAACFGILLTSSFSYSMLKTFILSDAIQTVKATTTDTKAAEEAAASATTTDTSYSDDNIQVSLTEKTVENKQELYNRSRGMSGLYSYASKYTAKD